MKIVMAAAENDALPGGKVGGIGDVVRDMPLALAQLGHRVDVVTPGYDHFIHAAGTERIGQLAVRFRGQLETVDLYKVPGKQQTTGVHYWALEHPLFSSGGAGRIYCDDGADQPFATDASKFALFCAALGQALVDGALGEQPDVLHLHDWHAAMLAVLRAYAPAYASLQQIRTVYTIHNLALQGIRPQAGHESALLSWFPDLQFDDATIHDPHTWGCFNPMRAAINLADRVHAVSPTYAAEILKPSDHSSGFFGGEGLELDLQRAAHEGRLHGILNGCEYPAKSDKPLKYSDFLRLAGSELVALLGKKAEVESAHVIALRRIDALAAGALEAPSALLTSVGRITDQKVLILRHKLQDGRSALEHLLDALRPGELFVLLGSGNAELEQFFTEAASRRGNFLFIKGYAEELSRALYSGGDLFIMPSSFEPCGISQMLAMRSGQPCLVHGVGGLADTVEDGVNGFAFSGDSLQAQAEAMLARLNQALDIHRGRPVQWRQIAKAAAAARFLWAGAARQCVEKLYSPA